MEVILNVPSCSVVCHYKVCVPTLRYVVEQILLPNIGQLAVPIVRPGKLQGKEWPRLLFGGIFDRIVCVADITSCYYIQISHISSLLTYLGRNLAFPPCVPPKLSSPLLPTRESTPSSVSASAIPLRHRPMAY